MADADDQEKKTRATRKRKALVAFVDSYDNGSSDEYRPPSVLKDDSSDDTNFEVKRKVKKSRKKETCHGNAELGAKRKKSRNTLEGTEDDSSDDVNSEVELKVKENRRKTHQTVPKPRRKNSRSRGRQPWEKSAAEKMKERKKLIIDKRKDNEVRSQKKSKPSSSKASGLGPYSVIGHWYIASGFMKDLTALFEAFDKQDSWRFNAFATCWQNCKFSLIYRGRYSFKELLEFTEEIIFWTKKFLSSYHTMKWRVGALYALYGLYYKHPFRKYCKIRMEVEEYENVVSLARSFRSSAENPDPAYVFYKLVAESAFYHVASSDEMGLNLYSRERHQGIMNYELQWVLQEHSASTIFPERERSIQKLLMEEYEKVKLQTWGNGEGPNKGMSYVQSSILSEVDCILAGLHEDTHQQPVTDSQTSANVNQNQVTSAEISETGQRKRAVREKAAALSTTEDFFKRKQLRSPQKSCTKKGSQHSGKSLADSASDDTNEEEKSLSVYDDRSQVVKLKTIMEFMQPPEEGALDISLRPKRFRKNITLQKHLNNEENDSQFDISCETPDSQNILLPNESPQERSQEHKVLMSDQNGTSLQQLRGKRSSGRKSRSPEKAVQSKKSPLKRKTRISFPKQKARRGRPRRGSTKNTIKCKNSQIPESHEILEMKNGHENLSSGTASVDNKQKESLPDDMKKKGNGKVLQSETFPVEDEQNDSKDIYRQICSENGSEKSFEKLSESREVPSHCTEEGISSIGADRLNSSALDKNPPGNICDEVHDDHLITCENVSEKVFQHEVIPCENVCEEVLDHQKITSKNVYEEFSNDESVISAKDVSGVCSDDTIMTNCESDQSGASTSHIINEMESLLNISQQNCSDMHDTEKKVLEVEIIASIPKKKSLRSILITKSMVCLQVNFQEDNAMVHSVRFKMSKKDLNTLQNNKEKLQGLQRKLHSTLPSRYKNHKLHLQLTIHPSVIDVGNTSETKQCKQEPEHQAEGHFKQNHDLPDVSGTLTRTDNTITHEEPLTSCMQKDNDSSQTTEGNHSESSFSHGTSHNSHDMSLVGNVLDVEMLASVPQENNFQSIPNAESMACLNVNFQVEGVIIHYTAFQISTKDLEILKKNKNKLESLKAKFRPFLPPKYQEYQMQLRLTVLQSITKGNETTLEHSRQGSDTSARLPQVHAKPFEANNATNPVTSLSQKGLSKPFTINEVHSSRSESSSAPRVLQNVSSVGEVKWYPPKLVDQEGNTYLDFSSGQSKLHEVPQVQKQSVVYINDDTSFAPDYCSSQSHANVSAPTEEIKTIKNEYQFLPNEEEIVPTIHIESESANMNETKPCIIYVDGTTAATGVCGIVPEEHDPESLDSERFVLTVHAENSLEGPGPAFMNNILSTLSPTRNSKDSYASPSKSLKSNYVKEKLSHSTAAAKKYIIDEFDTENCTILWKTKTNLNTINDKSLLTSLPYGSSSREHLRTIGEGVGKTLSNTVRVTDDLCLNDYLSNPQASTSRDNNTVEKNFNVLPPLSHCPSKSMSGNLLESARAGISVSKAPSNSVCSFYFFSKRNKFDLSKKKQTKSSLNSTVTEPFVPFLFMDNLLSKKEH